MKFILKFVVVSVIALLAAVIPLSLWLNTDEAKQQISGFVENFLEEEFGIDVSIEGLDISLPIIIEFLPILFTRWPAALPVFSAISQDIGY